MKSKLSYKWQFSKRERHAILFIALCYLSIHGIHFLFATHNRQVQKMKDHIYSAIFTKASIPVVPDTLENNTLPKRNTYNYSYKNASYYYKDTLDPKSRFSPSAKPFLSGPSRIEVNTADSAEWNSLPGIGDYMTKAILNYRLALGGFINLDQLKNMRQMRPETFEKIKDHLWCDEKKITPLAINTADAYTLSKNPYLNYNQSKTIVAYREKHGPFTSFESIEQMGILDDLTISSLRPYLAATFEQAAKNEPIR